jgi:hypothetical protein
MNTVYSRLYMTSVKSSKIHINNGSYIIMIETEIITSQIGRAVIMEVRIFKIDVIVFIGNVIMCLTSG